MSTINLATLQSNTALPPTIQNSSAVEIGTFCRAWVNFNGTGVVAIRASFNVSSITDNGAGDYTLNITTALSDTNYAAVGSAENGRILQNNVSRTNTTTVINVITRNVADVNADSSVVTVSVFR
jgi:hypothetical protein